MPPREKIRTSAGKGRFGTFTGVFTPNVLTILGLILFLRIGWVVGQAGLIGALAIIVLANLISLLTGLSLSSIATNMNVRAGGTYYMISRTLGLEIGGAIGVPLYFSQAISVAFYIIGFTEALITVFPALDPKLVSSALILFFGFLAYIGADFALRIQFVILAVLGVSLVSFFGGGWGHWLSPELSPATAADASFWTVFAIFFPAVTGITVGVSMSGDLKDPGKSIPRGTLAAILLTGVIYVLSALWLAAHATPDELIHDYMVMQRVALWPPLILGGVWAATLSSALGSVLAAPRTLQALAFDNVVPRLFGAQLGSPTEPRFAVLITTGIALSIVWMGNLDFVASIISMFFLNTYGMINLTAGTERLVGNPSFRPQFRVHWAWSLLGAAGCYGAMLLIDAVSTIIAVVISYGVYALLKRRAIHRSWGDLRSGIWYAIARFALIRLETAPANVKNWRPNVVFFTGLPDEREQPIELGAVFSAGLGVVTYCHLIDGKIEELSGRGYRQTSRNHIKKLLNDRGVPAFAACGLVENFEDGVMTFMQAHGLAGIEPNLALFRWRQDLEQEIKIVSLMRHLIFMKKSLIFTRYDSEKDLESGRRIDVWWRGLDRNAELMLLLTHIVRKSQGWEDAEVRVIRLLENEEGRPGVEEHINRILARVRVEGEARVLVTQEPGASFAEILARESAGADLIFLGMRVPEHGKEAELAEQLNAMLPPRGTVLFVRSAETEDILDVDKI